MHSVLAVPGFSMLGLAQALVAPLAGFLSLLLAAAALHKVQNPARARRAVAELTGLGASRALIALSAAGAVEVVAAAGLVAGVYRSHAALLAACLWAIYGVSIVAALLRGRRDLDCGCSFGATHRPLGGYHLARNALLVTIALGVALVARSRNMADLAMSIDMPIGDSVRFATATLAAFALLALYAAFDHVLAQGALRRGVIR
jgi:hypothetical protein